MAGPTTYFRDARIIDVNATESCTCGCGLLEKEKATFGGFFGRYEPVTYLARLRLAICFFGG
jgi:hypothetical protein